jgi:glutathione S-transferase
MPTLFHLSYSPWSEKARWALEHYGVRHRRVEHVPMIGEPLLKLAARRPLGTVSVPLLLDGARVVTDSWQIALHADAIGTGSPLFGAEHFDAIAALNDEVDKAMRAARALLTVRAIGDDGFLAESLPGFFVGPTRRMAVPLARQGARFILGKYHGGRIDAVAEGDVVDRALVMLDSAVSEGPIFGAFSFADIAACALLQFIEPVADVWLPLGPATRGAWTDRDRATRFRHLLDWRDRIYITYRRREA